MSEGPFAGRSVVSIVLPEADPTLGGQLALLELERAAFEAELGAPVAFSTDDPGTGARWLLSLDEGEDAASTSWEPGHDTIESRAADLGGLFEALNLWRTVRRQGGGRVDAVDCETSEAAVARVVTEVADTYPAFELRGLDWDAICARHVGAVREADDVTAALQRWVAELQDSHTWIWPGHAPLPYALHLAGRHAVFTRAPEGTAAHDAGVRPGWLLVEVDGEPPDTADWLARTAAPPHARPFLAGRRLLAGPAGTPRTLAAAHDGITAVWEEAPGPPPGPVVTWRRLEPETGYLRIEAWLEGAGVDAAVDAALADLRACGALVLDLRANPGGSLVLATRTRDRFLREPTSLGSIRYSTGDGGLTPHLPLTAEPADAAARWHGRLVVLTDELTFSSSEDFLLGLQGLEHVHVVGRPSGGGSGRPRSLRLLPGTTLTVSTALTYDRRGHCVEGAGLPVDLHVPFAADATHDAPLDLARSG